MGKSMALPSRISVIQVGSPARWQSCRSIASNLAAVYRRAFPSRVRFFSLPVESRYADVWQLAGSVREYAPDRVAFISNEPHPLPFLTALKAHYQHTRFPKLYFHAYGDFPLQAQKWLQCWAILAGTPNLHLGASRRQHELLKKLFLDPGNTACFPFSVDESLFHFAPDLRTEWRKKLRVASQDKVLIYSGRLSLQKNVSLLIECAAKLMAEDPRLRLWIVGSGDDLDGPLFGWQHVSGAYEMRIVRQLAALPPSVRARIWRPGAVSHETLRALYNAADAFVSLSLYHDEDYGMAPAEALLTGLPLGLTNWGGYSQFVEDAEDGHEIPVEMAKDKGLQISRRAAQDALHRLSVFSVGERPARAERAAARFGIAASVAALQRVHEAEVPPSAGFSPLMKELATQSGSNAPAYPGGPGATKIYADIYSAYLPSGT